MKIKNVLVALTATFSFSLSVCAIEVPEYSIVEETTEDAVVTIIVKYASLSADGTKTQMVSGLVSYPINMQPYAIILDNHHTITDNAEAPSVAGETASAILLRTIFFIVAPDYVGYGITEEEAHPYLCQMQNAANSVDLAIVARDIITKRNIQIETDTLFNIGYSQGGGVALAVHRMLEEDSELVEFLHFAKTCCGEGPYDVSATLNYMLDSTDTIVMPVILPLVVKGFLTGCPQFFAANRKFSDFFKDNLINAGLEEWIDSKEFTTDQISAKMLEVTNGSSSLKDFLNDSMFEDGSELRAELDAAAKANSLLDGWKVSYPLWMYHLTGDKVVPFINAQNAVDSLGIEDYEFYKASNPDHAFYGQMFYIYAANDIINFCKEKIFGGVVTPSDIEIVPNNTLDLSAPMYDILGRRVDAHYEGIIIQNGRMIYKK